MGISPAGTAFIRPDGSDRNIPAPKRVVNSCPTEIAFGDRVDVRIASDRTGQMVVVRIKPAN
jgi:hypothetical protein